MPVTYAKHRLPHLVLSIKYAPHVDLLLKFKQIINRKTKNRQFQKIKDEFRDNLKFEL